MADELDPMSIDETGFPKAAASSGPFNMEMAAAAAFFSIPDAGCPSMDVAVDVALDDAVDECTSSCGSCFDHYYATSSRRFREIFLHDLTTPGG